MNYRTTVTKQVKFSYGHHLPDYDGNCANYHGHNCTMEVSVSRPLDGSKCKNGMICDFKDLKSTINNLIVKKLDHKYLNEIGDITFGAKFKKEVQTMKAMPTAENMLDLIWWKLYGKFEDSLECIRISETDDSWCTRRRIN